MKYLFLVFALNFVQQRLGIALVMLGNEASYQKEKERKKKKKGGKCNNRATGRGLEKQQRMSLTQLERREVGFPEGSAEP